MSTTRQLTSHSSPSSRNDSADANLLTQNPCANKRRLRPCSMLGSSSTIAMVRTRLPIHINWLQGTGRQLQTFVNESGRITPREISSSRPVHSDLYSLNIQPIKSVRFTTQEQ